MNVSEHTCILERCEQQTSFVVRGLTSTRLFFCVSLALCLNLCVPKVPGGECWKVSLKLHLILVP